MSDGFTKFKKGIQLDPQSADPSNPAEGDIQYADGTARSEGIWEYDGSAWIKRAKDPTTTNGDIIYSDGTDLQRLAIGATGNSLQVVAGIPAWAAPSEALASVSTKTGAYTLLTTDNVILADATSGAFTLTLPTASGNTGKIFYISKIDSSANVITVDGNGAETISGDTTVKVIGEGAVLVIVSDGTNWAILQKFQNYRVEARGNDAEAITASTEDLPFKTVLVDTGGSFDNSGNTGNNTNDAFTALEGGEYLIAGNCRANAPSAAEIAVYIDGVKRYNIGYFNSRTNNIFSGVIRVDAGEVVTLRVDIGVTLVNSLADHNLRIVKLNEGY